MPRTLPNGWLQSYMTYTSNQESPRNFHLWTGLTILGAALKRHVWLDRGGEDEGGYYQLYPNMYTILVALSAACRKGVSSNLGISILHKVPNIRIYQGQLTTQGLIEYMSESQSTKIGSKIIVDCSTIFYASELQVFLSKQSFTQDIIPILTELYEGKKEWTYRTKSTGESAIPEVSPTLFGATTPESLAACMPIEIFGLGFAGRVIFVVENSTQKKIAWPRKSKEQMGLEKRLIDDLSYISNNLYGQFKVTQGAYDYFEHWYRTYRPKFDNPRMSGFYERKHDHILKTAMCLSVSMDDSLSLTEAHIKSANSLIANVEVNMPLAFQYTGTDLSLITEEFCNFLSSVPQFRASHRELVTHLRPRIKTVQELIDVIRILVDTGIVKEETENGLKFYRLLRPKEGFQATDEGGMLKGL